MQKKKRKPLYDALATEATLRPAIDFYKKGLTGMEQETAQYVKAKALLDDCEMSREQPAKEKAEAYEAVAEINRKMRKVRKEIAMCGEVDGTVAIMKIQIDTLKRRKTERTWSHER